MTVLDQFSHAAGLTAGAAYTREEARSIRDFGLMPMLRRRMVVLRTISAKEPSLAMSDQSQPALLIYPSSFKHGMKTRRLLS